MNTDDMLKEHKRRGRKNTSNDLSKQLRDFNNIELTRNQSAILLQKRDTIMDEIYEDGKNYNADPDKLRVWADQIELINRLTGSFGKPKESPSKLLRDPKNRQIIDDIKKEYMEYNDGSYTEYIESLQQLEDIE